MSLVAVALALALHASLSPTRAAPLESVAVAISLTNRGRAPVTMEFPDTDLFSIQVRDAHGRVVFDSRSGHKPIQVHRKFYVPVGTTQVAIFDWNGLTDERHTPQVPGDYVVHVEMQSLTETLVADLPLTLLAPQPISSILTSKPPGVVTLAGKVQRDAGVTWIRDASGSIPVSNPLGLHPQGSFVVRGALGMVAPDERPGFVITRFAPAADNLDPQATPTPTPLPSPTPTVPRRSG